MDKDGNKLIKITKKIFSMHDRYLIDCPGKKMEIIGNILGFNYRILVDGQEVGHIARKVSLRDSYVLDIDDHFDYWLFVALVIAVDNITDQRRSDASSSSYSN